ncbi:MAG: NepR family anti-sigma factor [Hyphomicrobiales bacterium]
MTGDQPRPESEPSVTHESDDEADVNTDGQNEDWVAASLKQLYRSTVEEGIPDDMLALLDALDDEEDNADQDAPRDGEASDDEVSR